VTNPMVTQYDSKHATLVALVEANHLLRDDHRRNLLLKNNYTLQLTKVQDRWLIENVRIDNIWMTGDPSVLFAREALAA
jgi:hypothetical protein